MKFCVLWLALGVGTSLFVAGCGKQPTPPRAAEGDPLTASDLARLIDFHAWTLRIPATQQPVKSIRIVLTKHDGTFLEEVFDTGENFRLGTNFGGEPYSSILLGFRVEHEAFSGHLFVRNARGAGVGWDLLFTNAFADTRPAWSSAGPLEWTGNRAELAMSTRSNNFDTIMSVELVK